MLIPDVAFYDYQPKKDRAVVLTNDPPPQIVFEITSDSTANRDHRTKPQKYLSLGIQYYTIFDRQDWMLRVIRNGGDFDQYYPYEGEDVRVPIWRDLEIVWDGKHEFLLGWWRGERLLNTDEYVQKFPELESEIAEMQEALSKKDNHISYLSTELKSRTVEKDKYKSENAILRQKLIDMGIDPDSIKD